MKYATGLIKADEDADEDADDLLSCVQTRPIIPLHTKSIAATSFSVLKSGFTGATTRATTVRDEIGKSKRERTSLAVRDQLQLEVHIEWIQLTKINRGGVILELTVEFGHGASDKLARDGARSDSEADFKSTEVIEKSLENMKSKLSVVEEASKKAGTNAGRMIKFRNQAEKYTPFNLLLTDPDKKDNGPSSCA
ncbi:hypothetical protein F5887DRAFT_1256963 [Amanita rubescens]|nr:hypothetical protein F5887DRAFT_1256963 [Amanita rubescens]